MNTFIKQTLSQTELDSFVFDDILKHGEYLNVYEKTYFQWRLNRKVYPNHFHSK